MNLYHLRREQSVVCPRAEVFSFFAEPENLAKLTPASLDFQTLTPLPITMKSGTVIDYTIRVLGLRRHWRTLIESYEPPHRFVDIQLIGPYLFWHHTHTFRETAAGTLIADEVHYALPFGIIGRLAHRLFVKKQLTKIFAFRARVIRDIFGSSAKTG